MRFEELGLTDTLLDALDYMGFEEATPIQEASMPHILNGEDVLACAQTGTGKTAAFILPILNKLSQEKEHKGTRVLVICPTRELAIQIDQQIQGFAYFTPVESIAIYGGGSGIDYSQQKRSLESGVEVIVATPGKLNSHLAMGYIQTDTIEHVILDEADRMLDIGFYEDILKAFSYLPKKRQTLLFSATMPPKIRKLSKELMVDPFEISIAMSKPAEGVLQAAYLIYDAQKTKLVTQLIADKPNYQSILIFSSTKAKVNVIVRSLKGRGFTVEGISSDLEQSEREAVLQRYKSRATRVLVATDVLSRGIDIKDINLVINYDVPNDAEDYVHRIGRTARANTTGVAITLVNEDDMYKFAKIEELIEKEVVKAPLMPELGEGPKWNPKKQHGGFRGGGGGRGKGGGNRNGGGNRGGGGGYKGKR